MLLAALRRFALQGPGGFELKCEARQRLLRRVVQIGREPVAFAEGGFEFHGGIPSGAHFAGELGAAQRDLPAKQGDPAEDNEDNHDGDPECGFEAREEPLLREPITLHKRSDRDTYLCQFVNDENRAFRDIFTTEHPTAGFPAKCFGASQDASNKWVHKVRGEAHSLTAFYDFVVVGQEE